MDRINSEKAYIAYQGTEEGSSESSVSGRPLPCKSKLDSVRKTLCGLLLTPRRCRFNHDEHGQLSMILAMLFGLATAFTVANLFYSQFRIFLRQVYFIFKFAYLISFRPLNLLSRLSYPKYPCSRLPSLQRTSFNHSYSISSRVCLRFAPNLSIR